jgi:methionyl-tRNA formyltransferase
VAVLTAAESPLSGYYLESLLKRECIPRCVLVDRKTWSQKDLAIHADRTEGRLPPSVAEHMAGSFDVVFVDNHNSPEAINELTTRRCEVIANAGTPRILNNEFLDSFRAVVNCHPGILPKYRGCTCVEWAVFNDDEVGSTAHLMTAGIDEGPIIRTEALALSTADDYVATRVKVYLQGCSLLAEVTRQIADGAIDVTLLPQQGSGSYWKPIDAEKMEVVVRKLREGKYRFQSSCWR